jgi:hypothetical protein
MTDTLIAVAKQIVALLKENNMTIRGYEGESVDGKSSYCIIESKDTNAAYILNDSQEVVYT